MEGSWWSRGAGRRHRLPSVLAAVAEEFDHVGEEQPPDLHQLGAGGGALQQRGHHLQDHWERVEGGGWRAEGSVMAALLTWNWFLRVNNVN